MAESIKWKDLLLPENCPGYILYRDGFPILEIHILWDDTLGADDIRYVVQIVNK